MTDTSTKSAWPKGRGTEAEPHDAGADPELLKLWAARYLKLNRPGNDSKTIRMASRSNIRANPIK